MGGLALLDRVRQLIRLLEREGGRGVALRFVRRAETSLAAGRNPGLWVLPADVVDSARLQPPTPPAVVRDRPLRIGWITTPPAGGSGGHTTMLRMVRGLEEAGHGCVLALYDVHDGEVGAHARRVRAHWPDVRAEVRDARAGLPLLDAWIATSWETAHVLAARPKAGGHRFYFVQDYEPHFYAHGSEYVLAEDTYRFGFHGITAGGWLAEKLVAQFGMVCDAFEFGADTNVYRLTSLGVRDGVVFYAKPGVPRRAFALGVLALSRFAERHPEVPIHLFGDDVGGLPFPVQSHGRVSPDYLNELYNTCRVGLSLSMTNVSLIPWELLASGVIPVVNDAKHNRRVLDNEFVRWSAPTPAALAETISAAYVEADVQVAESASRSVLKASWSDASAVVTGCIERVVAGGGQRDY
jgi:O-antigen biosynthesis protein